MSNDDLLAMLGAKISATPAPVAPFIPMAAGLGGDDVLAASSALSADATVPGMLRPFMPHQAAAYLYCLGAIARFGGALLGDDMGMGKTQVMLALAAQADGYSIVIAPPVTLAGYKGDIAAAFPALKMFHAKGRTAGDIPAGTDIVFLSDDPLTLRAWLTNGLDAKKNFTISDLALGAGMLIRDEMHRDKGADGKPGSPTSRARLMLHLSAALRSRGVPIVGATGTLLVNGRPIEALIPLQIIGGMDLVKTIAPGARNSLGYAFMYCKPENKGFGYNYSGCDRDKLPQLHEYFRRTVYCRRDKDDLGAALPSRRWLVRPLALNGVLARYNRVERDVLSLIREESGPEAYLRAAKAEKLVQIMKLWEEAGAAKGAAAVEYITDLLDEHNGRPVLAFYWHKSTRDALIDGLSKAGISMGLIDGTVSGASRESQIAAFQAGKTQVMLAQIGAAGIGVTLTAAADAVFVQIPWSSGLLKQAADRILRVDDKTMARATNGEHITWHVLQACKEDGSPTFDGYMFEAVQNKAQISDAVNAGKEVTMPDEDVIRTAVTNWFNANS